MENTIKKPKGFGSKKSGLSVLPIILSSVMAGGALAGAGVGVWQIAKNYTESPEFTKSVKGRVRIDPFAGFSEEEKVTKNKADAESITADCAAKLSRWLKDQGQESYDVSYECYDVEGEEHEFDCFLTAQFKVDKVYRKHFSSEEEKKEKIDNDPYLSFYNTKAFNTNEKTLVYRWWIQDGTQKPEPKYTVLPFRDLFEIPKTTDQENPKVKTLVDESGGNGVLYTVSEKADLLKDIFQDLATAKKDNDAPESSNVTIDAFHQPRLYIVNNIDGLYNEATYHINNWFSSSKGQDRDYQNLYEDSTYAKFSEKFVTTDYQDEEVSVQEQENRFKLDSAPSTEEGQRIDNVGIFNYIDRATAGTNEVDFTKKYVDDIITIDKYENVIPQKITDDYKNDVDFPNHEIKQINYFWLSFPTKNETKTYLNNQIKYGFDKASIADFDLSGCSDYNDAFGQIRDVECKSTYVAPSFVESVLGGNNVIGILSLGFLIFLIALLIILAVLYRTTGVMSWICMIFALSMTGLIASLASTAITMALLIGLFTMSLAMFLASLVICGRMRRRLNSNEDTQLMIKKTFRKSLLPIVDISVITLIFGVCFTYIAPIGLNALGLVLIIGAFATFISIYLLNGALHGLFFNNSRMIGKFGFFGKPTNVANEMLAQKNAMVPVSMDATKLELAYYSKMGYKKIDATNKKALIAVAVIGALLIVGIIVFSVLGIANSNMYHTDGCLAIQYGDDLLSQSWFKGLSYVSYKHDLTSGWWYFYSNAGNLSSIASQMSTDSGLELGKAIYAQSIIGSTNQDILNLALISVLVSTLCCSVYGAIRYNWIAFVPMLAGSFGLPLLILGLASICQVKFDNFVVLGFVLVTVVNTIFSATMIGSINEAWSRKEAYNKQEFKYIVNIVLTNNWRYIWVTALGYFLFIILFALTSPAGTASIIGLMIIGFVVTMLIAPFTLGFLLYQFMKVRNVALNKLVARNKNKIVKNYDDIDEQGIEGINQFTKHIPVSSEAKPQGEQ